MAGYWDRPEKTAETLRGGWLHTGDVGFIDAEGYVFMRGRLSERLTVAGEHWYPRDVEEILMRHDAVRDAALIGAARRRRAGTARWRSSPCSPGADVPTPPSSRRSCSSSALAFLPALEVRRSSTPCR